MRMSKYLQNIYLGDQVCKCPCWICKSHDFHTLCVKQLSPLTSNNSLYPAPIRVTPVARYFLLLLCWQYPIQICKVKDYKSELEFSPSSLEYETSARNTFQLCQVAHSLIVFIPRSLNKGESLPKTCPPLFQGWDLPAHQFSVCIWASTRIQHHCKHGGATREWVALELLALFYSPCLYTTCFIDGNRIGCDPPGVLSWNAFLPDPSAPLQALWRWPFMTPRPPAVWVEVVVAIKTSGTNRLTSAFFVAHLQQTVAQHTNPHLFKSNRGFSEHSSLPSFSSLFPPALSFAL